RSGAPNMVYAQVRSEVDATIELELTTWGKLQLALTSGSQQLNLLTGNAVSALAGSTAAALQLGDPAASFHVGDYVVVDLDYTGQTGFVGAGACGAYVRSAIDVNSDADYIRR